MCVLIHYRHNQISESKVMVVWIWLRLPCSILSVLIYYRPQSNIRVKSYDRLNFLGTSLFNFESLDILWPSIKHSCQKLSSLNLFVASLFNFECLDILWVLIGHPSQKLSPSQFSRSFHFQFQTSQYIMGLNRTSE